MLSKVATTIILLFGFTFVFAGRGSAIAPHERAAEGTPGEVDHTSIGRFQLATFGGTEDGDQPGYLVIDTATGQVWTTYHHEDKPRTVSEPLLNPSSSNMLHAKVEPGSRRPEPTTDSDATKEVKHEPLYIEMVGPNPELPLPALSICEYNAMVTNRGNELLENVRIQVELSDGWKHESGKNPVELQLDALKPGQSRQVRLPLELTGTGRLSLNLTVSASETHTAKLVAAITADDGVCSDGEAQEESN